MSRKPKATNSVADRIKARLATDLAPVNSPATPDSPLATPDSPPTIPDQASARHHFLGNIEQLIAGRVVQHMPVTLIAPDLRPQMLQPRMLPLPMELQGPDLPPSYRELVAELRTLGHSLRERQIQPIIVYPGESEQFPMARYLILVGQRRWTAAALLNLETLDAIVVEPPTPLERVQLQYRENEQREDFSDMERAWTIVQLRQAMGDDQVSMEDVARQLGIKRARAYQLCRMLILSPQQQRQVALLRMQETQLRALLDAFHRGQFTENQVDSMLQHLIWLATTQADQLENDAATEQEAPVQTVSPRQAGIAAPTVSRLVNHTLKAGNAPVANPSPRWLSLSRNAINDASQQLQRMHGRLPQLAAEERATLRPDLLQLRADIDQLLAQIDDSPPTGGT